MSSSPVCLVGAYYYGQQLSSRAKKQQQREKSWEQNRSSNEKAALVAICERIKIYHPTAKVFQVSELAAFPLITLEYTRSEIAKKTGPDYELLMLKLLSNASDHGMAVTGIYLYQFLFGLPCANLSLRLHKSQLTHAQEHLEYIPLDTNRGHLKNTFTSMAMFTKVYEYRKWCMAGIISQLNQDPLGKVYRRDYCMDVQFKKDGILDWIMYYCDVRQKFVIQNRNRLCIKDYADFLHLHHGQDILVSLNHESQLGAAWLAGLKPNPSYVPPGLQPYGWPTSRYGSFAAYCSVIHASTFGRWVNQDLAGLVTEYFYETADFCEREYPDIGCIKCKYTLGLRKNQSILCFQKSCLLCRNTFISCHLCGLHLCEPCARARPTEQNMECQIRYLSSDCDSY
jgi:hypothetical protein